MKENGDERDDDFEDEVKPEDGLIRYWTFLNGEQFRLFAALAAASSAFSGVSYTFSVEDKAFQALSYSF